MVGNVCRLPGSLVLAPNNSEADRNEAEIRLARNPLLPLTPAISTTIRYEGNMPTFIKLAIRQAEPVRFFSDEFLAVALFSGIGLLLTLVALSCGVQGVWL
jgi:hypothetical protein